MVFRSLFGLDPSDLKRLVSLGVAEAASEVCAEGAPAASVDLFEEKPGDWIGPYRLVTLLGEGGMGIVFQAEQRRPMQRQVAIKLIKPGMDSKRILARFEAEQQALALMDHPHIARVFDAGITPGCRPYFVMEYVKGVPITTYCDAHQLSVPERLVLFSDVCHAIQHAHHRGIIHRDLKPSNILVQEETERPVAKVIDFGVARAMHTSLTDQTISVAGSHLVGTLQYMSPEQAGPCNLDVDTRTDVYSLGVVLYELLTGVLPFEWESSGQSSIERIRQRLCEESPRTPSTRLSTVDSATAEKAARLRRVTKSSLDRQLRGDLDWIAIKALENDRTRRYDTVSALALDVQRHLRHEPVTAVPPSKVYRISRYLRRHRSQAVSVALAIVLLVVTVTGLIVRYHHVTRLAEVASVLHHSQLDDARTSFIQRRFREASDRIHPLIDSPHVGAEARLLYASLLVEGKHRDQAVALLEALASEEPALSGVAHSLMARLYWESDLPDQDKVEKVTYHRQMAQERSPRTADAYFLQALTCAGTRDIRHYANAALEIDPGQYESRKLLALLDLASARYEPLRQHAEILIALRPQRPLGYTLKATALSRLGDYERAIDVYQRAIELTPTDDTIGIDLMYSRDYARLLAGHYDKVLSQMSGHGSVSDDLRMTALAFWAHIALGQFQAAQETHAAIRASSDTETWDRFRQLNRTYVFDVLSAERQWYPPDNRPEGTIYQVLQEADSDYHRYSALSRRLLTHAFMPAWSPDGRQLAVSLGTPGNSGLAILDVESNDIELLMTPGKDPAWSPAGDTLAFVRDRKILPLVDYMNMQLQARPRSVTEEEVWVIQADGTAPRRVAQGSRPSWSTDGQTLYYYSRAELKHFRVDLEEPNAQPVPVFDYYGCNHCYPSVSPDGTLIAFVQDDAVKVADLASGQLVAHWQGPPGIWMSSWEPGQERIWLGGADSPGVRTGLWTYDLATNSGKRVLAGPIISGQYSATGRLVFGLGGIQHEIWLSTVDDPRESLDDVSREQHCREMIVHYTARVQSDPCDLSSAVLLKAFSRPDGNGPTETRPVGPTLPFRFGQVENLGPPINSEYNEGTPFITRDGLSLYFCSNRPNSVGAFDIWVAHRTSTKSPWSVPTNLGETVNGPGQDFFPCLSGDGCQLYFYSEREGGWGRGDIWISSRPSIHDGWSKPANAGPPINGPSMDTSPHLSADGLELYFTSNRSGSLDLWVSTRSTINDPWSDPRSLERTINSPKIDSCPFLSTDGLNLFFNSTRSGQQDLYWTSRSTKGGVWHLAVPLGPGVNSECGETCASVSSDMTTLYFCECLDTPLRPGGHGGTDLWQISILKP